ncbi:SRPBCC domain-containing protein [Streptomyces johnsoniae]|uniref:SRPBCC domain-containing protein n=1 Tax=Streptomyces johnsoniae TaxID=3075532 RepID=A0ABU2S5Y0_9ACTN|nr:SRPBCC domain-containing protein [Streptomyces sp. DSM 41886]MDT0444384.1 SRPBCC domain-containing protein [Streptomyces sp. DSM 41886]
MAQNLTPLGEIHRSVGHRKIVRGEGRSAVLRRHYSTSIVDVWRACTEPDRVSRWLVGPEGDLREGRRYVLPEHAHGEILRCDAPHTLTLSWIYEDYPADELELRLSPAADGGTILEVEHTTVDEPAALAESLALVGVGWENGTDHLEQYLRGDLPDAPRRAKQEPSEDETPRITESDRLWRKIVASALGSGY